MPERENLGRELEPTADRGSQRDQQGDEQRSHLPEDGTRLWPATATATTGTEYLAGTARNTAVKPATRNHSMSISVRN